MGAKKKGLANKLAKMSDEDRARYLQHRADMEEEARRRKEQLISIFLKNKLKKEEAFSRLNVAKINQNWHQIMRKQKCKLMKEDVQNMRTQMDRVLDLKNRTIKRLIQELDEAEDQYGNNFQSHLNHITDMIDFGYKSLEEMHETYDKDHQEILDEAEKERRAFLKKALEEIIYLKTLIHQNGESSKKELRENYEHYFKKSDDVIRQNKEEFEQMRQQKESMIGDLWRKIANFLRAHVEATDVKRAHLAELQSLDAESAAEIAKNEEIIKRQEEEIEILEQQFEDMKKSRAEEIKELSEIAKNIKREHLEKKILLKKELDSDEKRIIFLTATSNETIKYLENLKEKGEKLLQLMQVCRKYETQEEKILRFSGGADFEKYIDTNGNGDDGKPNGGGDKNEGNGMFSEGNGKSTNDSNGKFTYDTINVLSEDSEIEVCESSEESRSFHTAQEFLSKRSESRNILLEGQSSDDKILLTTQQSLEDKSLNSTDKKLQIAQKSLEEDSSEIIKRQPSQENKSLDSIEDKSEEINNKKVSSEDQSEGSNSRKIFQECKSEDDSNNDDNNFENTQQSIPVDTKSKSLERISETTLISLNSQSKPVNDKSDSSNQITNKSYNPQNTDIKIETELDDSRKPIITATTETEISETSPTHSKLASITVGEELSKIDDEEKVRSAQSSKHYSLTSSEAKSEISRRFSEIKAELEKHLSCEESSLQALESNLQAKLEIGRSATDTSEEISSNGKVYCDETTHAQLTQTRKSNQDRQKSKSLSTLKMNVNQNRRLTNCLKYFRNSSAPTLSTILDVESSKREILSKYFKQPTTDNQVFLKDFETSSNSSQEKSQLVEGSKKLTRMTKNSKTVSFMPDTSSKNESVSPPETKRISFLGEKSQEEDILDSKRSSASSDNFRPQRLTISSNNSKIEELILDEKFQYENEKYESSSPLIIDVSKNIRSQRLPRSLRASRTRHGNVDFKSSSPIFIDVYKNTRYQRVRISSKFSRISPLILEEKSEHSMELSSVKVNDVSKKARHPIEANVSRISLTLGEGGDGFKTPSSASSVESKNIRSRRLLKSSKDSKIAHDYKKPSEGNVAVKRRRFSKSSKEIRTSRLIIDSSSPSSDASENSLRQRISKSSKDLKTSQSIVKNPSSPSSDGSSDNVPRRRLSRSSKDSKPPPVENRRLSKTSGGSRTPPSSLDENPDVHVMKDCFSAVRKVEGLWNAYNKVLIDCMRMRKEWKFLVEENEQLKGVMRTVLEAAVLEKISVQLEMGNSEEFIRNIHSADKVYKRYNIRVLD